MRPLILSPSTLSLFAECPLCFWLHVNEKIRRPSTPFPSLPSGMDLILKKHFDRHRKEGSVPEELEGKFKGYLFRDTGKLDTWRNNLRGLRFTDEETGVTLMGAIDDLFVTSEGRYAPLDFKTRGFPRKENTHEFYQRQMDLYSFLLEKNSLPPADFAILVFYHPLGVDEKHNVIFDPDPVKVPVDRKRGERIFLDAVKCLLGERPEPSRDCEFCNWNRKMEKTEEKRNMRVQKDLSNF
jgi:hypothetical protein